MPLASNANEPAIDAAEAGAMQRGKRREFNEAELFAFYGRM